MATTPAIEHPFDASEFSPSPELLRERRVSGRDAALATELTYGASRAQGLLDAVIAACTDRPMMNSAGSMGMAPAAEGATILRPRAALQERRAGCASP